MNKQDKSAERLSIKQVVAETGLSENYIRKAMSKGDLIHIKEPMEGKKTEKNWILRSDLEAWQETRSAHSRREDGRNKFVIYMTAEEEEQLRALLTELEFGETLDRANQPKTVAATETETE